MVSTVRSELNIMSDKKLSWVESSEDVWRSEFSDYVYVVVKADVSFSSYFRKKHEFEFLGIAKGANNFTEAATECEIHAFGTASDIDHLTAFAAIMTKFAALSDEDKASALAEIEKLLHV